MIIAAGKLLAIIASRLRRSIIVLSRHAMYGADALTHAMRHDAAGVSNTTVLPPYFWHIYSMCVRQRSRFQKMLRAAAAAAAIFSLIRCRRRR